MNPKLQMINMLLVTGQSAFSSIMRDESELDDEPDKTNRELLEILGEPENKPAIHGHLRIGGFGFVTREWYDSNKWFGP